MIALTIQLTETKISSRKVRLKTNKYVHDNEPSPLPKSSMKIVIVLFSNTIAVNESTCRIVTRDVIVLAQFYCINT